MHFVSALFFYRTLFIFVLWRQRSYSLLKCCVFSIFFHFHFFFLISANEYQWLLPTYLHAAFNCLKRYYKNEYKVNGHTFHDRIFGPSFFSSIFFSARALICTSVAGTVPSLNEFRWHMKRRSGKIKRARDDRMRSSENKFLEAKLVLRWSV